MTLIQAIQTIEKQCYKFQLPVQKIEYEDGSGFKFIYRLNGEKKDRFVDYSNNEFVKTFWAAKKIMDKL